MASAHQRLKRAVDRNEHGPANIVLEAVAAELNCSAADEVPAFSAVAYSGGKLFVAGFKHPVVVDLSKLEVQPDRTSVLLDHKPERRVGHIESVSVVGGCLYAQGRISAKTEHAAEVVQSHQQGFRWHVSIGARILEAYEVPAGDSVVVNGARHQGPVIVAAKAKLKELSFVGVGGDEANSVSIAAAYDLGELDMEFQKWVEEKGFDAKSLTDAQRSTLQAAYESQQQPAPQETIPDVQAAAQEMRTAAVAESKRIARIRKVCGQFPDIEAQAIEQGWDEVKAELEALRADRERAPKATASRVAEPEIDGHALEAALCMQFGLSEEKAGKHFDERVMNAALSRKYRSIGLHSLMYRSLQAAGKPFRPGRVDDDTILDFLRAEQELQAAGTAPAGFSYIATTGILGSTANKLLVDAFMGFNGIVPILFGQRSVSDFKSHTAYRLAANGELEEVGTGGSIKHADLSEGSYTLQAKTWGKMLTLTRQDMINDDLGAFEQIPRLLGRKAALKLEKEGWKLVMSMGSPFFSTDNYFDGAATNLQLSSLTTGEQKMLDLKDTAGDPIMATAKYLVTGTAIANTAQTLMGESRIIASEMVNTGGATKQIPALNPHVGKWIPLASPFINSTAITGYSATAWFLWADPADLPPFVVSYLNGRSQPTIESSDVSFERLGMSWRVVFDFGVDDAERLGVIKSKGAA